MRSTTVSSSIHVSLLKKLNTVLILAWAMSLLAVLVPKACFAELSTSEKIESFLANVVKLDMAKYTVPSGGGTVTDFYGLPKEEGTYVLEYNGSKIEVMYTFVNNTLSWFNVHTIEGSLLLAKQPSTNLIERTDAFLQDYQNYLGTSEFQQFRSMLATVSEVKDTAITVDNVRFEITKFSLSTRFRWVNTFNGADYSSFGISYRVNSTDFAFGDDRYKKIGSTDVNISLEEAIGIAREFVKNLTLKMGSDNPKYLNINFSNEPTWSLLVRTREPLTYYPYWIIGIRFNETIIDEAAALYGVYVSIWADTGEIISSQPMAIIGLFPYGEETSSTQSVDSTPQPSPTPQQSPSPSPSAKPDSSPSEQPTTTIEPQSDAQPAEPFQTTLVMASIGSVAIVGSGLLVYLKKRKHETAN